jgi:tetratricopeptide (TPR) repeat protein
LPCLDEDTIVAFAEGRLSPSALAGVESHLATCEVCRDLLAAAMRTGTVEQTMHAVAGARPVAGAAGAADAAPGPMPRGSIVGRYTVLALAGRGGMGEVYAAYDPEMDRKVALKLLRAGGGEDARGQARLLREGKAMARLSHPNVVSVHDAGTFGGRVFVAMEYVEGTTLRDWLAAAPRTQREILRVFGLAGRGLAAAHAVGLVHRDFKPQNVMLAADGSVRVMDFGLARPVGDAEEGDVGPDGTPKRFDASAGLHLTRTGEILGTPRYMAPEQFRAERTDARTDQFSFCVALYEALYGAPPFAESGLDGLVAEVLAGRVRRPPPKSNVRGWLRRAILRGLAPDPAARWPSMAELLAALAADPVETRKRRALVAGVTAVAALAGLTVARSIGRSEPLCQGGPARIAGAWASAAAPGPRRLAVQRAFLGSGAPAAGEVWVRVAAVLDRYAGEWLASYRDACEATQVRREQSAAMLDLRMTCLDQKRSALRALTDVLASADRGVVSKAVDAAGALPPVAACGDLVALQAAVEPPRDAATRAKVEEIRAGVARAKAFTDTGKVTEADELARRLVAEARAVGYAPLIAETLLRQAFSRGNAFVTDQQIPVAEEAVWMALAVRRDDIAAEAASRLAWAIGYLHARPREGNRWSALAKALLDRLGPGHELLRAWQLQDESSVKLNEKDLGKALELIRASLALREKILPPDHPEMAIALRNMAEVLHQLGRDDEALTLAARAHDTLVRAYGPRSGDAAVSLSNQGEYLVDAGRPAEAEDILIEATRIWESQVGPTDYLLGYPLTALGRARLALGHAREAIAPLERARRLREAGELDGALIAETRLALARALWDGGGDRSRALDLAARARQAYAQLGTQPKQLAAADAWLAAHPAPSSGARPRRPERAPGARDPLRVPN